MLRQELSEKTDKVIALQREIHDLQTARIRAKKDHETENARLREQIVYWENNAAHANREATTLKNELDSLRSRLQIQERDLASVNSELNSQAMETSRWKALARDEREEAKEKLIQIEHEMDSELNRSMRERNSALQMKEQEVKSMDTEVMYLRNELSLKEAEIQKLSHRLLEVDRDHTVASKDQGVMSELRHELLALSNDFNQEKKAFEAARSRYVQRIGNLESQIESLQADLASMERDASGRIDALRSEVKNISSDLHIAREEREHYKRVADQVDGLRDTLNERDERIAALQHRNIQEGSESQQVQESLRHEIEELKAEQRENLTGHLNALKEEKMLAADTIARLQREKESLSIELEDVKNSARQETARLNSKTLELQERIAGRLSSNATEIESLRAEMNQLMDEKEANQASLDAASSERNKIAVELDNCQADLESMKAKATEFRLSAESAEASNAEYRIQVSRLVDQLEVSRQEASKNGATAVESTRALQSMNSRHAEKEERLLRLEDRCEVLQTRNDKLQLRVNELQENLHAAELNATRLRGSLSDSEFARKRAEVSLQNASDKLTQNQRRLDEVERFAAGQLAEKESLELQLSQKEREVLDWKRRSDDAGMKAAETMRQCSTLKAELYSSPKKLLSPSKTGDRSAWGIASARWLRSPEREKGAGKDDKESDHEMLSGFVDDQLMQVRQLREEISRGNSLWN